MSRCAVAYHHGDLPAALLAAVQEAITDDGVSGVSLRDVARRAGVSHSAPAHHFGSKAGLLMAFAAEGFRLLAQAIRGEVASQAAADAAAQVAAVGQAYVRFAVSHPAHFEVMFGQDALIPGDRELTAARKAVYDLLTEAIDRAHQAGRLPEHSADLVAISAWSLVHGLATLLITGRIPDQAGPRDPQQIAVAVTTLFTRALMPPPRPDAAHRPGS
jgi:AcrR family transcriptional regulator